MTGNQIVFSDEAALGAYNGHMSRAIKLAKEQQAIQKAAQEDMLRRLEANQKQLDAYVPPR